MKLYTAFETKEGEQHIALWINSKVNFLVVECNGIQQAWNDESNPTSVNFPVQNNDSIDVYVYRNGIVKEVAKMTLRYCGIRNDKHSLYLIPDMSKNLDLNVSSEIQMLEELPYKCVDYSGNASYKIALHNEEEDLTVIEGANTENEALNAAIWGMSDNSPYAWASISHDCKTLHYIGECNQWANEKPEMMLSVRNHNRLHIGFSCRNKIKTSVFDGEKLHTSDRHMYTLELKKGQKFVVSVLYPNSEGETVGAEVTYHYIDGLLLQGVRIYVDMTLYLESISGLIDINYSPQVKFISMKKLVYMPHNNSTLENKRFHFGEEIVFDSANDALLFAMPHDTVYQCFVPGTSKEDGVITASRLFVVRSI